MNKFDRVRCLVPFELAVTFSFCICYEHSFWKKFNLSLKLRHVSVFHCEQFVRAFPCLSKSTFKFG